jgi:8-oxo-dGTP diphosphatase
MLLNIQEIFWNKLKKKLNDGVKLIQLREKALSKCDYIELSKKIITIAKNFNAKVLINSDIELANKLNADGIHLNSSLLHKLSDIPKGFIVAASCHNKLDIEKAIALNLDFVVLSPVQKNSITPKYKTYGLGWI